MNRTEYLLTALKQGLYKKKAWMISAFALIKEGPEQYKQDPYPYRLVQSPTGFFYVNPEEVSELLPIEGALPNQPLYHFKESVRVDATLCPNLIDAIDTTLGQVFFNLACIVQAFGKKFPFVTGKVSIKKIEDQIAEKLLDTPTKEEERNTAHFYVDEYVKFVDSLSYVTGLSQLCVWAATEKNMTSAPGFHEFKATLLKKYAGKLNDPVELSHFEKELQEFDDAYLKGDPTVGVFMSGKVRDVSRKKMFLTLGSDQGFTESLNVVPVLNSLEEGWPTDTVEFTAMMNGSRAGSFSRGSETMKGGVAAKVLLRSAGNVKIKPGDCGTALGIHRLFDRSDIGKLVGRSIRTKTGWLPVTTEEEARGYIDKPLIVRSEMYCLLDGDNICEECAGKKLAQNPTGVPMALTEISSIILNTSLKAMHGKVLSTAKMDYRKAFS